LKGIEIYVEGGGTSAATKATLRKGMSEFLKELRGLRGPRALQFKVIPCGSRGETLDAFRNGLESDPERLHILLVDSEDVVDSSPIDHLRKRDGWSLSDVTDGLIHLMVCTMETWLVADPDALERYYGQGFRAQDLPRHQDLERVSKAMVASSLDKATRDTTAGEYHKTRHGSVLLERIDPARVRARCRHCERLFATIRAKVLATT